MALPRLWTARRVAALCGLSAIGIFQAVAALAAAIAGSRLLTGQVPSDVVQLHAFGLGFAAAALILLRVLQRRFAEAFALDYVTELRAAFMSHVLRIPADSEGVRSGLVMTRVVNDLSSIKQWLANGLVSILVALSLLATVFGYLMLFDPAMTAALLPAIALWAAIAALSLRPLERHIRKSRRQRGRIAAKAGAVLAARLTLLLHGRHGQTIRALRRRSEKLNAALIRRATLSGLLRSSSDLIFPVMAIVLGTGLFGAGSGAISGDRLGVLIVIAGLVATQLTAIALGTDYLLAHRVAVLRLRRVMARPAFDPEAGSTKLKRKAGWRLTVDRAAIGPERQSVSFETASGEQVALTGLSAHETGALFFQIAGLSDSSVGSVTIDGIARRTVPARDWWRNVTLVSDKLPLVPGTIGQNAFLGAPSTVPNADRTAVLERLGIAEVDFQSVIIEGSGPSADLAAAIRASRGILRQSGLVLIDDPELYRRPALLDGALELLGERGATIVIGPGAPGCVLRQCRVIDLSRQSAEPAQQAA